MQRQRTVIDPQRSGVSYWKDLWAYRGLFRFLAWRDLLVRYKQTVIGIAWAVIKPLLTILIFAFFAHAIATPTHGVSTLLFVTAAILPWQLFSSGLNDASNSLISNSSLISKIYFPRLIVPLSTVIVCLVDFLIALVILIVLMFYYGQPLSANIVFLPLFLLLAVLSCMGAGVFLAALNVKFRDFRYVVPFVVQLSLYVSPVAFISSFILDNPKYPETVKILFSLNPLVAVIDGFRWCLFGNDFPIHMRSLELSCCVTIALLVFGTWYFRRVEKNFADII